MSYILIVPFLPLFQVAHVIREGEETEVPAEELVIGDIISLATGDKIPADCRILESNNFMVDNSNLSGESDPQDRDINCTSDSQILSKNMAFYSTYAVQGTAKAVVTRTGLNTIMGKMTELTADNPKAETLITREISRFLHLVTGIAIYLGLVCFIIAFLLGYFWIDCILFLIGVIVAGVPEGLLAVVTLALSISAKRLGSRKGRNSSFQWMREKRVRRAFVGEHSCRHAMPHKGLVFL